jgi:hypothetical protein
MYFEYVEKLFTMMFENQHLDCETKLCCLAEVVVVRETKYETGNV